MNEDGEVAVPLELQVNNMTHPQAVLIAQAENEERMAREAKQEVARLKIKAAALEEKAECLWDSAQELRDTAKLLGE
jgi:hypothetical protein